MRWTFRSPPSYGLESLVSGDTSSIPPYRWSPDTRTGGSRGPLDSSVLSPISVDLLGPTSAAWDPAVSASDSKGMRISALRTDTDCHHIGPLILGKGRGGWGFLGPWGICSSPRPFRQCGTDDNRTGAANRKISPNVQRLWTMNEFATTTRFVSLSLLGLGALADGRTLGVGLERASPPSQHGTGRPPPVNPPAAASWEKVEVACRAWAESLMQTGLGAKGGPRPPPFRGRDKANAGLGEYHDGRGKSQVWSLIPHGLMPLSAAAAAIWGWGERGVKNGIGEMHWQ